MHGHDITLTAADGFQFAAYEVEPEGTPKGAIVLLQEIFGVNSHIRAMAERYASEGYFVVAPATFSRLQADVSLGYGEADMQEGVRLKAAAEALPAPGVLQDIQAAVQHAAEAGKVGIVGFCWGGLLVWRSAAQVQGLSAAVAYYGGGMTVGSEPERKPLCPTIAHFGDRDGHISVDSVEAFKAAHPEVTVYRYDADHGFNCDQRGSYDEPAARLAHERTLAFFAQHLA